MAPVIAKLVLPVVVMVLVFSVVLGTARPLAGEDWAGEATAGDPLSGSSGRCICSSCMDHVTRARPGTQTTDAVKFAETGDEANELAQPRT